MPNPFPPVPPGKLATAVKLCGGVALLVALAVVISNTGPHQGLGAAVASAGFTTISLSASPSTVRLGSSANLAYSVANTMSSGSATTLNCFGDNNNCSTPIVNGVAVPKGAYLSMGTTTDGTNTYLTIIDWEQVLHNSVTGTKRTGPELDVYEWVPGSQCWGNGTTCLSSIQTISNVDASRVTPFTIGGISYIALPGTADANTTIIYKWTTSGAAPCSTGGGWGDGTTCGATFQTIAHGNVDKGLFTVGSKNYLVVSDFYGNAVYLYTWTTAAGCPTGGSGWGSGTVCGTANKVQQLSPAAQPYGLITTLIGGVQYLTVFEASSGQVFVWTPTGTGCPAGGGFGNGTACGSSFQTLPLASGSGFYSDSYSSGSTAYLALGNLTFEWTPSTGASCSSMGGWGDGTTCGNALTALPTINGSGWSQDQFLQVGSDIYLTTNAPNYIDDGGGTPGGSAFLFKWLPASSCFGGDNGCGTSQQTLAPYGDTGITAFSSGSTQYISLIGDTSASGGGALIDTFEFFQKTTTPITATPCFGNGTTCGATVQTLQAYPNTFVGSVALNSTPYLAFANRSQDLVTYEPTSGCASPLVFGNGTTCGTPLYTSTFYFPFSYSEFFAPGGVPYAATQSNSLYSWITGQNCFGWGTTCNSNSSNPTNISSLPAYLIDSFTVGSNLYGLFYDATGDYNQNGEYGYFLYQWMPAQVCWGDGTTCEDGTGDYAVQQFDDQVNQGGSYPDNWGVFTSGSTLYLAAFNPHNGSQGQQELWEWTSSGTGCPSGGGFGNGTSCATPLSASRPFPGQIISGTVFTAGATYLASLEGTNQLVIYQWMPSQNCFGDTNTCGAALYASTLGFTPDRSLGSINTVQVGNTTYIAIPSGTSSSNGLVNLLQWMGGVCTIADQNGAVIWGGGDGSGSVTAGPLSASATYTLSCNGVEGYVSVPAVVSVTVPTVTLGADKTTVRSTDTVNLNWTISGI